MHLEWLAHSRANSRWANDEPKENELLLVVQNISATFDQTHFACIVIEIQLMQQQCAQSK